MFQVEHVTLHQLDAGVHRGRVHDRRELLGVARDRLHAGHEAEDVPLPTAAPNIALVVGVYVDPNMHEVSHFCLPHLLPVLKNTVRQLYEVFEYYETILATQLPYTCYKCLLTNCLKKFFITQPCLSTRQIFSTPVQSLIRRMRQGNFRP